MAYTPNFLSGKNGAVLLGTQGVISTLTGSGSGSASLPLAGSPGGAYTTTWAFGKWRASPKVAPAKVTNFTGVQAFSIPAGIATGGTFTLAFQQLVTGVSNVTINLEGPYDAGNMPLLCGFVYLFSLFYTSTLAFNVNAMVDALEPFVDVEGAEMIRVTSESTGFFMPLVV